MTPLNVSMPCLKLRNILSVTLYPINMGGGVEQYSNAMMAFLTGQSECQQYRRDIQITTEYSNSGDGTTRKVVS